MNRPLTAIAAIFLVAVAACGPSDKPKAATSQTANSVSRSSKATRTASSPKASSSSTAKQGKPSIGEDRKKAASILENEDQDFRDFLAKGVKATGTAEFTAWYQKAIVGLDMKQTAFSKADAYFTADNEPTDVLEKWRSDNGEANSKITQYAMDGTSPDAPNAKTRRDAAAALSALEQADRDAEKLASGK
ncbi:hypothetical protein ACFY2T_41095 [Streptomyces sp. NPDC001260]|uniref:hypothetical protein n=1 Tax=Streptomyces sp. NPDC001260 TaxID=3364551 RepID=UPI0036CA4012